MHDQPKILATKPSKDYELLDSGEGEKLERFGGVVLRRPDPQALWSKSLTPEKWDNASARFVNSGRSGVWKKKVDLPDSESQGSKLPDSWPVELSGLTFGISLSAFKHTGLFPEQSENWNWLGETIGRSITGVDMNANTDVDANTDAKKPISVLNLFGYTGGATLAAAKAGASVTHVDGSKVSVNRARENAKLSGLEAKPIRWIVDDVSAFVRREIRRGNRYDGIIMDPPAYGHGPKKELWEIETNLPLLIAECRKILSAAPIFILLNGYASGYSAVAYKNSIVDLINGIGSVGGNDGNDGDGCRNDKSDQNGGIEFGELALEAESGRQLPAGIFARWRS
ncbi:MAG: class I SAM-dependent methyltransferase [Patescibacteria group bacterium]